MEKTSKRMRLLMAAFAVGLGAVLCGPVASGQALKPQVFDFRQKEAAGVNVNLLEAQHQPAVDMGSPEKGVFPGREQEVIDNWTTFLQDLDSYLHTNGFRWDGETKIWLRTYFGKDGRVDAIGFSKLDALSPEKQQELLRHAESFAGTYRFGLTADKPFVQCGTARFNNKKE